MADKRRFTRLLCGSIHVRRAGGDDDAIAELARRQHGVAGRPQLLSLGIGEDSVDYRLALGRLRFLYPGVYAVGHEALAPAGHALAAVMAVWPAAAASQWAATAIHGLTQWTRGAIHVSAEQSRRPRPGLVIHRAVLPASDLTIVDGVPATTVARTLLDMSAVTDARRLRSMVKRAEFKGLVDADALVAILECYPRRRGRGPLARMVSGYALSTGPTMSPIEDDFIEFCVKRKLPLPQTNVPLHIGGQSIVVDCLWSGAHLIVELDGRDAHDRHLAFEDDRTRDRSLTAAGWRPMRVTSAQIRRNPGALETDLRAALSADKRGFTRAGQG